MGATTGSRVPGAGRARNCAQRGGTAGSAARSACWCRQIGQGAREKPAVPGCEWMERASRNRRVATGQARRTRTAARHWRLRERLDGAKHSSHKAATESTVEHESDEASSAARQRSREEVATGAPPLRASPSSLPSPPTSTLPRQVTTRTMPRQTRSSRPAARPAPAPAPSGQQRQASTYAAPPPAHAPQHAAAPHAPAAAPAPSAGPGLFGQVRSLPP